LKRPELADFEEKGINPSFFPRAHGGSNVEGGAGAAAGGCWCTGQLPVGQREAGFIVTAAGSKEKMGDGEIIVSFGRRLGIWGGRRFLCHMATLK
ncbi:hypothetical protein TorRG33x02_175640, partial [Trema orientale]